MFKVVLEFFCGVTFFRMWYQDSEKWRFMFFVAYCIYVVCLTLIEAYIIAFPEETDELNVVKHYCLAQEQEKGSF